MSTRSGRLAEYRRKRDFSRTREPQGGGRRKSPRLAFVIQKHDASRLHYDLRLELDGVMKSWAVPKGPSLDPSEKRLAVETEDHPLAYGSFEGTIPEGEYGAGEVELWDRGTWEPEDDPSDGYRKGKLTFTLHGKRLHGAWHLVRTGRSEAGPKAQWLLIKGTEARASEPKASAPPKITGLSHPERVLFPEVGLTKADLARYYDEVASVMLPHVARRPLMLKRCPEGRERSCFFQKHAGRGTPDAVREVPIREKDGTQRSMFIEDEDGLGALVQLSSLEIHVWGARVDDFERPDRLVFDLDPGSGIGWDFVIATALGLRAVITDNPDDLRHNYGSRCGPGEVIGY